MRDAPLRLRAKYAHRLHIQTLRSSCSSHFLSYLPCGDFLLQSTGQLLQQKFIITCLNGEIMQPAPPKHTVWASVKKGRFSIHLPMQGLWQAWGWGIMMDPPLHNSPRSIINKLLKTYRGAEEWRKDALLFRICHCCFFSPAAYSATRWPTHTHQSWF